MSTLSQLLRQVADLDPGLGSDLAKHVNALKRDVPFGLHFERHRPESVRLFGQQVMVGDKVHVLPPRGKSTVTANPVLWHVTSITGKTANLVRDRAHGEPVEQTAQVEDLVVVAEFRDDIYPGLVQTGEVINGADDAPFHTVINGENYHALKALTYTHAGRVDAIYIDPPYNTRDRDWKYNNDYVDSEDDYRHSKWLAMMERRLEVAKQLLNPDDSVLIVTIDENEQPRLAMLLEQMFPEGRMNTVAVSINPKGTPDNGFGRVEEFVIFIAFGAAQPQHVFDPLFGDPPDLESTRVRWRGLTRTGANGVRSKSPGAYYPIFIKREDGTISGCGEVPPPDDNGERVVAPPGTVAVWPTPRPDGTPGRWSVVKSKFEQLLEMGAVRAGRVRIDRGEFPLYYLTDPTLAKIESGEIVVTGRDPHGAMMVEYADAASKRTYPRTVWTRAAHSASEHGSGLLTALLKSRTFSYPKSLYAVEDALRLFVGHKQTATVLDFFSGSGTTAHAVMRLNRQDGGRRQCISVTNNEAGDFEDGLVRKNLRPGDPDWERFGICDYITKPRITAAITGETPQGDPLKGDYKFTDEFPMSEGFEANARFFTLTYERDDVVNQNLAFKRIAPLLWMRAGSVGRVITDVPDKGWEVADSYAILFDLDQENAFVEAVEAADGIRAVYVVTNDQYNYQQVAKRFPGHLDKAMLYRSYLTNFRISNSE